MKLPAKIGEVIEANTTAFLAQCYELHQPPPLGSLVRTAPPAQIYGVVCDATTTSIEPGRRPLARGQGEESEGDVFRQHPQLAYLLRTEFRALVVGHRQENSLHYYLAPFPARIHGFVYLCDRDEVAEFSRSLDFLSLLARPPQGGDEIVAACLRHLAGARDDRRAFLVKAGKELALLLAGEPQRLNTILRRLREN